MNITFKQYVLIQIVIPVNSNIYFLHSFFHLPTIHLFRFSYNTFKSSTYFFDNFSPPVITSAMLLILLAVCSIQVASLLKADCEGFVNKLPYDFCLQKTANWHQIPYAATITVRVGNPDRIHVWHLETQVPSFYYVEFYFIFCTIIVQSTFLLQMLSGDLNFSTFRQWHHIDNINFNKNHFKSQTE